MTQESTSKPFNRAVLCIFKHVQQKFSTLFGSLTLHPAPLFGWGRPTNPTTVTMEWHALLLKSDILQILDGLGSFTDVLKVNKKI